MKIVWAEKAAADIGRLHEFLSAVAPDAAAASVSALLAAPSKLIAYPRLGERVDGFEPREVRRVIVGRYEMRYEIAGDVITILRIWHGREERL
jgi:plasmid stabilization system protein ParE